DSNSRDLLGVAGAVLCARRRSGGGGPRAPDLAPADGAVVFRITSLPLAATGAGSADCAHERYGVAGVGPRSALRYTTSGGRRGAHSACHRVRRFDGGPVCGPHGASSCPALAGWVDSHHLPCCSVSIFVSICMGSTYIHAL